MKLNTADKNKSGIYIIKNKFNNKVYVGKSKNIYIRIKTHVTHLNTKCLDENRHLINSWHKYGKDKFEYYVVEYIEFDEDKLKERELSGAKPTMYGFIWKKVLIEDIVQPSEKSENSDTEVITE